MKHRTICFIEPNLGGEEPAAPNMKSHEIRNEKPLHAPSAHCLPARRWFACCCMPTRIRLHSSAPIQPLHACLFVCNDYSYALKCSLQHASMHTNIPEHFESGPTRSTGPAGPSPPTNLTGRAWAEILKPATIVLARARPEMLFLVVLHYKIRGQPARARPENQGPPRPMRWL
jgi:hypothetical protein